MAQKGHYVLIIMCFKYIYQGGGVAQMVERSLSMREVPGSIPGASRKVFFLSYCHPLRCSRYIWAWGTSKFKNS